MKAELTIKQSNQLKSIAILMMLALHLFNRPYQGLFEPLIFIGKQPLSYYISLFSDSCVPIFAFVSGYGLFYKFTESKKKYAKSNLIRIGNLYINFWIILILFVVLLGTALNKQGYPGDVLTFVYNFTAINVTYNGAWWFLTTYLLFVITSTFWFKLLLKLSPIFYLALLFILYVVGFYFRFYDNTHFSFLLFEWIKIQSAAYFFTLFQFMLGAFVLHYRIISYLTIKIQNFKFKNYSLLFCIPLLIAVHGLIPNLFFAPLFGFTFIMIYCQLNINSNVQKFIDFFTPHTTNMWLIHMFFYQVYFSEFVYSARFVIPIFLLLVALSVVSSIIINKITPLFTIKSKKK